MEIMTRCLAWTILLLWLCSCLVKCCDDPNLCNYYAQAEQACVNYHNICPQIQNLSPSEAAAWANNNAQEGNVCTNTGSRTKWCTLTRTCIPENANCSLKASWNMTSTMMPWGEPCPTNEYGSRTLFCPLLSACIPEHIQCSFQLIVNWLGRFNVSNRPQETPYEGVSCPSGMFFCAVAMKCILKSHNCSGEFVMNDAFVRDGSPCDSGKVFCLRNGECYDPSKSNCSDWSFGTVSVNFAEVFGLTCGADMQWCENSMQCVQRGTSCPSASSLLNLGDEYGYTSACRLRKFSCLRAKDAQYKCSKRCGTGPEQPVCPDNQMWCEVWRKCIPNDVQCMACGDGFYSCFGRCVPVSEPCKSSWTDCAYGYHKCQNETCLPVDVPCDILNLNDKPPASCLDCFMEELCKITRLGDAEKLFLYMLGQYRIVEQGLFNTLPGNISVFLADVCLMNKLRQIVASFFGLPAPVLASGCFESSPCYENKCLSLLGSPEKVSPFGSSSEAQDIFTEKGKFLKLLMQSVNGVLLQSLKFQATADYATLNRVILQQMPSCPTQTKIGPVDIVGLFVRLFRTGFCVQPFGNTYDPMMQNLPPRKRLLEFSVMPETASLYLQQQSLSFIASSVFLDSMDTGSSNGCWGLFKSNQVISRLEVMAAMQRAIMGCWQCPSDLNLRLNLNRGCSFEELLSKVGLLAMRMGTMSMNHLQECRPGSGRSCDVESLKYMGEMIREILGCSLCKISRGSCSTCVATFAMPRARKYVVAGYGLQLTLAFQMASMGPPNGDAPDQKTTQPGRDSNGERQRRDTVNDLRRPYLDKSSGAKSLDQQSNSSSETSPQSDQPLIESYGMIVILRDVHDNLLATLKQNESEFIDQKAEMLLESKCLVSADELLSESCGPSRLKLKFKFVMSLIATVFNCLGDRLFLYGIPYCKPERFSSQCFINEAAGRLNDPRIAFDASSVLQVVSRMFDRASGIQNVDMQGLQMKCSFYRYLLANEAPGDPLGEVGVALKRLSAGHMDLVKLLFEVDGCGGKCVPSYRWCDELQVCIPEDLNCPSDQGMAKILPHVYLNSTLSPPFLVSSFSGTSPAFVFPGLTPESHSSDEGWEFERGGLWYSMKHLGRDMGVYLSPTDSMRYNLARNSSFGIRVLRFSVAIDENYTSGAEKSISSVSGNIGIAVLLVLPVPFRRMIVSTSPVQYVLPEDGFPNDGIPISRLVNLTDDNGNRIRSPFSVKPVPNEYFSMIPYSERRVYTRALQEYENSRPYGFLVDSFNGISSWHIFSERENAVYSLADNGGKFPLDVDRTFLVLKPRPNFFGTFMVQVLYCAFCLETSATFYWKVHGEVNITVTPVNDRPERLASVVMLPPIPYNLTMEPNHGFKVSDIATNNVVIDDQGQNLGLAIFQTSAISGGYGRWQVRQQNDWKDIEVANEGVRMFQATPKDLPATNTSVSIFLLNPDTFIRFSVVGDQLWTQAAAMENAFLIASYWDRHDGLSEGKVQVTMKHLQDSSAYSLPALLVQMRRGCDGRPGSLWHFDSCGKCGGNGKACLGCDGVVNSGAKIDQCGSCTGGSTGLRFNYLKDCAGTCGASKIGSCGICQPVDTKYQRDFRDCSGVCFGKALVDKCGECTGGSTNRTANSKMDVCGVCGGNGSSCLGCDGIANSKKVIDKCGKCLHPSTIEFDASCIKVYDIKPSSGPSSGGSVLFLNGAGFSELPYCQLEKEDNSKNYSLPLVSGSLQQSSFALTTSAMSPGLYRLRCRFGRTGVMYYESERSSYRFMVYDTSLVTVHSVTPTRIPVNTSATLTVMGSGFVDTGEIQCVRLATDNVEATAGLYINASAIECSMPSFPDSQQVLIGVFLSPKSWTLKDLRISLSPSMSIDIYGQSPKLLSGQMEDSLRSILLAFNEPGVIAARSCAEIFSNGTLQKLGGASVRCFWQRKVYLQVFLGSDASLRPSDRVTVLAGAIRPLFSRIYEPSPEGEVVLMPPEKMETPVGVMTAPLTVGACERLVIIGNARSGSGGRPVTYKWGVSFVANVSEDQRYADLAEDLDRIKSYLESIPETQNSVSLEPAFLIAAPPSSAIGYKFSLTLTNFLNQTSEPSFVTVSRVTTAIPTVGIMGPSKRTVKTSQINVFSGLAQFSSCQSAAGLKLNFLWETSATGVTLDEKSRYTRTLYLPPYTLPAGKTYEISLTVSVDNDVSLRATATVNVEVIESALVARIRGGNRAVGSNDNFTIDGSLSYDPDGAGHEQEWHNWDCLDDVGAPCFITDDSSGVAVRLFLPALPKVVVDAAKFTSNQTYKFVLRYGKGYRTATAEINVLVTPGQPPLVRLQGRSQAKENPAKQIIIQGGVDSFSRNVRIRWECVSAQDFSFIDLTQPGVVSSPLEILRSRAGYHSVTLVLSDYALNGGASYLFRLVAETIDGIGFSEIRIFTNAPPSIGKLTTDFENGTALLNDFTIISEIGWEDDAEDFPLTYCFGYLNPGDAQKRYLGAPSMATRAVAKLPTGAEDNDYKLVLFVEVRDNRGAMSEARCQVTVLPPARLDVDAIADASNAISDALATKDLSAALSSISTTLTVFESSLSTQSAAESNSTVDSSVGVSLLQFKENVTKSMLSMAGSIQDEQTQNVLLDAIGELTRGGHDFEDATKLDIAATLAAIVRQQIGTLDSPSSRRRRSAEAGGSSGVSGKTPGEVESILSTFANIINATRVDNYTMSLKSTFVGLGKSLLSAMCVNAAYGGRPLVALSPLGNLQSYKYDFANAQNTSFALTCTNCSTSTTGPAMVLLGSGFDALYQSWSCADGETCNGACVGSIQYPIDLFSADTSNAPIADVVSVAIFNPVTSRSVSVGNLSAPVTLTLPLKNESNTGNFYACRLWDDTAMTWSENRCATDSEFTVISNVSHAVCRCSELGVVSVVSVGARAQGAHQENAEISESNLLAASASHIVKVQMKFAYDYDAVIASVGKSLLEAKIKSAIVATLDVDSRRVINVSVSNGSILADFVLLPPDEIVNPDALDILYADIARYYVVLASGRMKVTLNDGSVLEAVTSYVAVRTVQLKPPSRPPGSSGVMLVPTLSAICMLYFFAIALL